MHCFSQKRLPLLTTLCLKRPLQYFKVCECVCTSTCYLYVYIYTVYFYSDWHKFRCHAFCLATNLFNFLKFCSCYILRKKKKRTYRANSVGESVNKMKIEDALLLFCSHNLKTQMFPG